LKLVALAMLRELNPQKGEYIVQSAAASTLGRMIIQVARHLGFKVLPWQLISKNRIIMPHFKQWIIHEQDT
jgi:hypothetical protein